MKQTHLQDQFDHFAFCTFTENTPKEQVEDMRVAFFAGAATFLSAIIGGDQISELPDLQQQEILEKKMASIDRELRLFFEEQRVKFDNENQEK